MLESVLADVLTRVLGQYLEGIDRDSVRFGAWSGLVELRGVALRPEALAVLFETLGLDLPVTVEAGFIGLLRLQVPWQSIGTTPVQIHMEDITILARPVRGDGSDDSELENRERRIKRARLNTDDAVREVSWGVSSDVENSASSSWSTWLVSDQLRAKIVDNIQIHLKDIILRFEDHFSNPQQPYIASVACEALRAVSVNEQWEEAFVERKGVSDARKLVEVIGFRIDWAPITPENAPGPSRVTGERDGPSLVRFKTAELLKQFVTADVADLSGSRATTKRLLHSVDGSMRLRLTAVEKPLNQSKELQDQDPAVDLDLRFPEILLDLDDVQYASLLQTSVYFARLSTRGLRPKTAKARWTWAVDQLLPGFSGRRARAFRFTEKGIAEARDKRILYVACRTALLKARRSGLEEPKDMAEQLEHIEDGLSFSEVLAYRDRVDRMIETGRTEWRGADTKTGAGGANDNHGTTTSSFWRMLGYSDQVPSAQGAGDASSRESFGSRLGTACKSNPAEVSPRLSVRVGFLLQCATLRLWQGGYPDTSIERVALKLQKLHVGFLYATTGQLVMEAVLGGIEAWNMYNNVRMVYSRLCSIDENGREDLEDGSDSYPKNVSEAIESIRSGSNPAKDVLLEEEKLSTRNQGFHTSMEEDLELYSDILPSDVTETGGNSPFKNSAGASTVAGVDGQDPISTSTYRVTESEFLGNPRNLSGVLRHIAAFRFTKKVGSRTSGELAGVGETRLEVSIATLEAVVDGPKGSFLWGLRFWKPKGMVQDPIMAFLGAAAGARVAELRIELEEALLANRVPMQINAVIMAPRFIIPGAASSDPAFVVNMGTLGICTSDNSPEVLTTAPNTKVKLARYSNYVLTLDDLGVYFCPSLCAAASRGLSIKRVEEEDQARGYMQSSERQTLDTTDVERVIRPFSLRFVLQSLRDSSVVQVANYTEEETTTRESDIAKVRLRGNIPGLSVMLTLKAFQHLSAAAEAWSEELYPRSLAQHDRRESTESKNLTTGALTALGGKPFTSSLAENSLGLKVNSAVEDNVIAEKRPATIASYDVKVLMQKVSVEIRQTCDVRLVTATAYEMITRIVKTGRRSVSAEFSLCSFSVTDGSRGSTAAFRRLLYAGSLSGPRGVSPPRSLTGTFGEITPAVREGENFVNIRYNLNLSSNEQSVSFRFLSLKMVCVRETYVRIGRFFSKVREYMKSRRKQRQSALVEGKDSLPQGTFARALHNVKTNVTDTATSALQGAKLSVVSEFDGFHFQLVASGGAIAVMEMKDSRVYFCRYEASPTKLWGDFRLFSIRDLTAPIDEHVPVVTYERPSVALEKIISLEKPGEEENSEFADEWSLTMPGTPDEALIFKAAFRRIKILFLSRFSDVIRQYASVLLSELQPSMVGSTDGIAEGTDEFGANSFKLWRTRITLELRDISVRIPRHSSCSTEALNIHVSSIELANVYGTDRRNDWESSLHDLQMAMEYKLLHNDDTQRSMSVSSTFLTGLQATVILQSGVYHELQTDRDRSDQANLVNVNVTSPVRISLCEAQYTVLYFVVTENFAETISGMEISNGSSSLISETKNISATPSSEQYERDTSLNTHVQNVNDSVVESSEGHKEYKVQTTATCKFSLPFLSVEVSRGWDVTQESCKVMGIYLKDANISLKRWDPYRLLVELEGHLMGASDLRMERRSDNRSLVMPLTSDRASPAAPSSEERKGNISVTYDKEGSERPSIVVFLTKLQLEVSLSLFRDLTYLAVPGWPFLQSSSFAPEIIYLGRTMNVLLSESQVVLRADESQDDQRGIALTGEFLFKVDWKRLTAAKRVSMRSSQVEISTVMAVPPPRRIPGCFGVEACIAEKLKISDTPLAYPTDSFLEYVGPDVDEAGRRIEFSVDAFLCVVCTAEIPLLKVVVSQLYRFDETYLTTRDWVQPAVDASSAQKEESGLTPKEKQIRKARENINLFISVPAARYLLTDDRDGRFVPILEARLNSTSITAHGESMVQVGGEVSLDLFNPDKGWWEPAIETWNLTASMSRGQSGTRAFVVRSDRRLNMNITPTTVTASLAVVKALKAVSKRATASDHDNMKPSEVPKVGAHTNVRRPSIAAFLVRNELGVPVTMCMTTSSRKITIANNTEVEVGAQSENLLTSTAAKDGLSREKALRCSVTIPSSKPLEVSAAETGIHALTFFPATDVSATEPPSNGGAVRAVWDVRMTHGVPGCTLRSPLRIRNDTKTVLQIKLSSHPKRRSEEKDSSTKRMTMLEPGNSLSITLQEVGNEIAVRPLLGSISRDGNIFEWSAPLPTWKWMKKNALETARAEHSTHKSPSTMSMRMKRTRYAVVCKSKQNNGCDFFVTVIPNTLLTSSRPVTSPNWVDIALKAPVVLENKLPGPLGYRVFQRDNLAVLQALEGAERDGAVLAAGVIEPLQDVHLHFSRDSSNTTYLSLAYDNYQTSPSSRNRETTRAPSGFGPAVNFAALNPEKRTGVHVSPRSREEPGNQARRAFMASLLQSTDGSRVQAFAGFWVRNRSDTAIEVCNRNSFYGAGGLVHFLRERPPYLEPDNYVCCEGPYLSIRLPRQTASSIDERTDYSNWWTSASTLDDLDKPISIALPGRSLELEVRPAIGTDCQTNIVTIRNAIWIVNSTNSVLQWCQASALDAHGNCRTRLLNSLTPGESQGIHWEVKSSQKAVHLRLGDSERQSDWIWSPAVPVNIGYSRELPAKMYRPKSHEQYIARVMVKEIAGSSKALVVFEEDRQNPPYKIINLCKERAVAFRQTGSQERLWLVRAGKTTRYSWDDPLAPRKDRLLSVRIVEKGELAVGKAVQTPGSSSSQRRAQAQSSPHEINIDVVGESRIVSSDSHLEPVTALVSVDGATKVVTFSEVDSRQPPKEYGTKKRNSRGLEETESDKVLVVGWEDIKQKPVGKPVSAVPIEGVCDYPTVSASDKDTDVQSSSVFNTDAAIFLESISVSIVDAEPCEIIYIQYTGILINFQSQGQSESCSLTIDKLQVDNQLFKTPFPVLLSISPPNENINDDAALRETRRNPHAVLIEVHRDVARDDILMITSFQAVLRSSNVYLEDGLITRVIRFLSDSALVDDIAAGEVLRGQDKEYRLFRSLIRNDAETVNDRDMKKHKRQNRSTSASRRIYVHDFGISSSSLLLTSAGSGAALAKAAGMPPTVRAIVGMLLNVDNCEFLFAPLHVQNVFDSMHHFLVLVREYYVAQLTSQRMKLLASNSLVGNPAALFDAVGTGARDFFNEPGRAKGSAEFIASVGRGSKSLFAHTVGGIVESVSGIPRAVSSGIEAAVGDKDYLAERQRIRGFGSTSGHRGSAAKNPAQGLTTGAVSFAHGISSGVHGLIREPVQGAKQGGASGLLKGIGKAFIGGVAKPVAGAIDLVAEPAAGLSRQIGGSDRSRHEVSAAVPDRPPRAFRGRNPRLETYDRRYSLGVFILQAVQALSGFSFDSKLIEWVELSRRNNRSSPDSDLWIWDTVRRFARSMPGSKKQIRKEERQSVHENNAKQGLDSRVEKTRVALVTETDMVIATLDCKLVTTVPLWEEAVYEIAGDGKELVITAKIPVGVIEGSDESSTFFQGAQSLITAPWDVSAAGKRKKPSPGSQTTDRIACGSFEARDELRRLLGEVIKSIGDKSGKYQAWMEKGGKHSSGVELTLVENWTTGNETEMQTSDHQERLSTVDISRLGSTPATNRDRETRRRSDKIRTPASLERTVRRLSASGSRKDLDCQQTLRLILANKLPVRLVLRLNNRNLEHGVWKSEAPIEIVALDAQIFEVGPDGLEDAKRKEVSGVVVYDIIEDPERPGLRTEKAEPTGQIVVEFFCGKDEAASFTTRATPGYQAEFVSGGGGHGTAIFTITQTAEERNTNRYDNNGSRGSNTGESSVRNERDSTGSSSSQMQQKSKTDECGSNEGLSEEEKLVHQLVEIGFKFEDAAAALAEAGGDMVKAVDILTK